MPSFMQTIFLGGEWSPNAQGRMDSDHYKWALNECTNYYAVESGALIRRMGTRFLGTTKGGVAGRVMGLDFSAIDPYQLEFTDGFMRAWREAGIVTGTTATATTISTATPAKVTASGALPGDWVTGDTVIYTASGEQYATVASRLRNWQFKITVTAANQFTLADAVTGSSIDGTNLGGANNAGAVFKKVFEVATPYTSTKWRLLRKVHDETNFVLLQPTVKPYVVTKGTTQAAPFLIAAVAFKDGPYLDPNTTSTTFTFGAISGATTLVASAVTGINGGAGFASTDVGRMFRVFTQPATWSSGSNYVQGDSVSWEGNFYSATRSVRAGPSSPAENVSSWAPVNDVAFWSWGTITSFTNTTHVGVTIDSSSHALVNLTASANWRLGLYCDTLGWPTCGAYHENRLWLAGAAKNRIDGSKTGDYFNFAPSSSDGTVADDNACADTFKAVDANDIFWLLSEDDGLWAGTQAGEWRIRASALDDPITPTSVQARRITTFGSSNQEAICAPATILFVQRQARKVLELMATQESESSHYAPNLSLTADHMLLPGIAELAWQQEPTNMLWSRMTDGTLRLTPYMRAPNTYFAAWTRVVLGCNRTVESISTGPNDGGTSEKLFMVTSDEAGIRHVNVGADVFTTDLEEWAAEFSDDAIVPSGAKLLSIANGDAIDGVRFYGLHAMIGMSVAFIIGGLDLGDFVIATDTIDIPFTADFTIAFLNALTISGANYGRLGFDVAAVA